MTQLTVKDLKKFCEQEIKNGNGNKLIVVSDDNEGNGFHGLFYAFTTIKENEKDWFNIYDSHSDEPSKVIVLG